MKPGTCDEQEEVGRPCDGCGTYRQDCLSAKMKIKTSRNKEKTMTKRW